MNKLLDKSFFSQPAPVVAKSLLGMVLVHHDENRVISGRIVETEAYNGPSDLASHASRKNPKKARILFGTPGIIYIYKVYGLHFCLNVVTGPESQAGAVLFRAIEPLQGIEIMRLNRGANVADRHLGRGPGNLTRAFGMDERLNGRSFCSGRTGIHPEHADITAACGPRVGVAYAGECADWPWRFWVKDSPCVSKAS